MKKTGCLLILLAVILVLFQAVSFAEDNLTWTLNEGVLTISGSGEMTSGLNGKFTSKQKETIVEIVFDDNITSIQYTYAFSSMPNLKKVTLPATLRSIAKGTFYQCFKLESCDLPDQLEEIGEMAFYHCPVLTGIVLPNSLKTIGASAFCQCKVFGDITIPDGVQSIGAAAFDYTDGSYCAPIYAKIGTDGAKALGAADYAFYESSDQKYMLLYSQPDVLEILSVDRSIEQLAIPDGVTKIGDSAFANCTQMTKITLPDEITDIGAGAFSGCTALTSVRIPAGVTVLAENCFSNCKSLTKIQLPDGLTSIEGDAFAYSGLTEITIPNSVTNLGGNVFGDCTALKSVVLPSGLTAIPTSAFSGSGIVSITLPDTVETIGNYAFYECPNLQTVRLSSALKAIPERCFRYCEALQSINIPAGLTGIGAYAFQHCTALTGSITIPQGVTSIPDYTFQWCNSLTEIVLPEGLTNVGKYGLACSAEIPKLPDSLVSFAEGAFEGASLGSIRIPAEMSAIPVRAFCSCNLPAHLDIPSNIQNIWDKAFSVTNIRSVTFEGQCAPGIEAFSTCSFLSIVCFRSGSNTNRIGEDCFDGCISLKNVYINADADSADIEYYGDDSDKGDRNGNNPLRKAMWHFGETYTGQFSPDKAWSEPEYTWDEEHTTVTASRVCACNNKHTQQETVRYTSETNTLPTCEQDGQMTFTAEFKAPYFTTQTKCVSLPALGHDWDEAGYTWAEDCSTVTATRVCRRDAAHTETETAKTVSEVMKEATTEAEGVLRYTAEFSNKAFAKQIKDMAIPKLENPEVPENPENPVDPENPEEPVNPEDPVNPENPEDPVNPENPENPEDPANPDVPSDEKISIAKAKITKIKDQVYTGKKITPKVTVKLGKKTLKQGTDYKLSWKSNKAVGTATVTVTGQGSYTGKVKANFNINPKPVTLSSVKSAKKQQLTVKWKKGSRITGYEIQYGLKKNFKDAKTVTIKKAKTTGTVLKKLKSKKTYYVRIRAYKTVKGKKYYSAWSKTLKKAVK